MDTEIKFYGLSETLFYLKEYEAELYKSLRSDLVEKATPLAQLVGSRFPEDALRNWHAYGGSGKGGRLATKSRLPPYVGGNAQSMVKAKAGTGSTRGGTKASVILRIQQMDGAGQVYDSAGSVTRGRTGAGATLGQRFIANLDKHTKIKSSGAETRSRILFGAVKNNQSMIEKDVLEVVKKIDAYTTKAINAGTGK